VAFTKVLNNILYLNSPLHHSPLNPPPAIPQIVSAGLVFHLNTCVHSICTIFILLYPFHTFSPLLLVPSTLPPGRIHWHENEMLLLQFSTPTVTHLFSTQNNKM
jgi:hypothetical protein